MLNPDFPGVSGWDITFLLLICVCVCVGGWVGGWVMDESFVV